MSSYVVNDYLLSFLVGGSENKIRSDKVNISKSFLSICCISGILGIYWIIKCVGLELIFFLLT